MKCNIAGCENEAEELRNTLFQSNAYCPEHFREIAMTPEKPLKLYIWTGFCPDRTGGLAVAIAETVDEAKLLVQAEHRPRCVWDWGTLTIRPVEKMAQCVDGRG